MATHAEYINKNLDFLKNYIKNLSEYERKYNQTKLDLYNRSTLEVRESYSALQHELRIQEAYRISTALYKELGNIAQKYNTGIDVGFDIQQFNQKLNMANLPVFEETTIMLKTVNNAGGTITGGAAMPTEPKKADFSETSKFDIYMNINMWLNRNYPDAQELANIFLANPDSAPESEEYKFIKQGYAEVLNAKYNLTGTNKEINKNWSGFAYSRYSTLSKNVSNFSELKSQIEKQYDESTGQFKTDKIDIDFESNKNLHLALGHSTILEPKIDKNGYFHGILFDKYDFDLDYTSIYENPFLTAANNHFWRLQQIYHIKNFYILAPIRFKW